MKRRVVSFTLLFFWLASGLGCPAMTGTAAAFTEAEDFASQNSMSSDRDYDGLTDDLEAGGWWNAAGFFTTDPFDPDSDNDGLTDGEEKLYDTDPLNDHSPGIYVAYENHLKTRQYWDWQQYGDRFISLDDVVVRRGATFSVGGPTDASIHIDKSLSYLTTLTPVRDPCSGRWRISVPSGGRVGKYKISLKEGGWSKSLDLYVIFELPTPTSSFTQAMIEAFLYDDDPANLQDEIGILLNSDEGDGYELTHDDYPSLIPSGEWINAGLCYEFDLQPFEPFVFKEHVIKAINGCSSQWDAVDDLVARADQVTRFDHPRWLTSSWSVLHPGSDDRQQCSNIAGLLTAFARSAGIPARPSFMDRVHGTFDHATETWVSGSWRVSRSFASYEPAGCGWNCSGGYYSLWSRYSWGGYKWRPWHSGRGGRSSIVGTSKEAAWHAYRWPSWDWDTIVRYDWFETLFVPYWGWSREPRVTGTPPDDWPSVNRLATSEMTNAPVSRNQNIHSPIVMPSNETPDEGRTGLAVRGVDDYGLDLDGDGYFDQLVIEIEVNAPQPGTYWFQGQLGVDRQVPTLMGTGGLIATAVVRADLAEGTNRVQLPFEGLHISAAKMDGPYVLRSLSITDVDNPGPDEFVNDSLGYWLSPYTTAAYQVRDFQNRGATLSGEIAERGLDADGDRLYEALTVEVGLNLFAPGTYTVQGDLYDSLGGFVARATWTGTGSVASLQFDELAGTVGPYTLKEIYLLNAGGEIIDSLFEAYTTQQVMEAEGRTRIVDQADSGQMEGQAIVPDTYSDSGQDLDGDGLYDLLVIDAQVEVVEGEADLYRLEGWLASEGGSLISWASSAPISLTVGTHSLSLPFSGPAIRAHNTDGPFTLMALKLLRGAGYEVDDEVDVAYTTSAYTYDQFEEALASGAVGVFEDNIENGSSQWTVEPPWTLTNSVWHSYSHAWKADVSGSQNGSLTALSLDLSNRADLLLKFSTCYDMQSSGDVGYLEVSTNEGLDWTRVATYTSATSRWSTELLDLSSFIAPNLQLRFDIESQDGLLWYVDDVYLTARPDDDGDGLSNVDEDDLGTDPDDPDSDDDGLSDGGEVHIHDTDPLDDDSDDDGLTDGPEVNDHGTDPDDPDSDDDGMSDGCEVYNGLNPLDDSDADDDPDGDGLTNGEECNAGTDPHNPDTDDDGIPDGEDLFPTNACMYFPLIFK